MKNLDVPTILLIAYACRLLAMGASIGDAIALAALVGLNGFIYFVKENKEPEINSVVKAQLEAVQNELKATNSKVNAMQIGNQLRGKL